MALKQQSRKRDSRGSRSVLSVDLWRSISRARSRSALRVSSSDLDLRSQSSLSCDPSCQPAPRSSSIVFPNMDSPPPPSNVSFSGSFRHLHFMRTLRTTTATSDRLVKRKPPRPLSWLHLSRTRNRDGKTTSNSLPLPHQDSMVSVAKSSISSPMLTSTTNATVANTENVEYSDVLLPDYSGSRLQHVNRRVSLNQDEQQSSEIIEKPSAWSSTIRSVKKSFGHARRASTSLLLESPWTKRAARRKGHSASMSATSSQALDTIHGLGGKADRRNIKSTSESGGCEGSMQASSETHHPHGTKNSLSTPHNQQPPCLPGLYSDSTTDLLCTSLSRSFASAIDKLDYQSSPTLVQDSTPLSRLKKAKSYFSLHKMSRDNSQRSLGKGDMLSNSSLYPPTSASVLVDNQRRRTVSINSNSTENQVLQRKLPLSQSIPSRFSGRKYRCVAAYADARAPRDVDPLRMHPEVGVFAQPASTNDLPSTPGQALHRARNQGSEDHDQTESIERAIIYSPSTDTLSEYSRQTPSPSVEGHLSGRRGTELQETPTRKPLHRRSGSMLKKSVSTFFGKSASMIKFTNFTPSKKSQNERDLAATKRHASWHSSAYIADGESFGSNARGRSVSTPEICGAEGMRAIWDYQPLTPSPLRESTKLSTTSNGRQRAVTTTTPVHVPMEGLILPGPRSVTVLSNPEKRYARYMECGLNSPS